MTSSFCGIFKSAGEVDRPDYALLGVPHDTGSSYRPGARLGPRAIREMANSLNACTERGDDLSTAAAVDAGDLELPASSPRAYEQIEDAVGRIVDDGAVPIVLGGDHAVTAPAFTAVWKRHTALQLLYLDAHPDLYPDQSGDPYGHGCVVHRILDLDGLEGRRITQVGIRASTPPQRAIAEATGLRTVHAWEVDGFAYEASGPVYLSVDIDVLDPAHAPGCGNPVAGGLSTRQLFTLLQGLDVDLVGVDLVEVNPMLDSSGITALAAAQIVTEILGVMATREGSGLP